MVQFKITSNNNKPCSNKSVTDGAPQMPMPHYLEKTNMSTPAVTARYVLISCDDLLNFNHAIIEFFLGKCLH